MLRMHYMQIMMQWCAVAELAARTASYVVCKAASQGVGHTLVWAGLVVEQYL